MIFSKRTKGPHNSLLNLKIEETPNSVSQEIMLIRSSQEQPSRTTFLPSLLKPVICSRAKQGGSNLTKYIFRQLNDVCIIYSFAPCIGSRPLNSECLMIRLSGNHHVYTELCILH